MAKVEKGRVTAEFRKVLTQFEESFNQAANELIQALRAQGWTQGEAENFFAEVVKNANIMFPPKGEGEIADEFLYGQGEGEDIER